MPADVDKSLHTHTLYAFLTLLLSSICVRCIRVRSYLRSICGCGSSAAQLCLVYLHVLCGA